MAKQSQPAARATGETTDRVEGLARDLFLKFAQPLSNREPEWLAVQSFRLAEAFYRVADETNRDALFAEPEPEPAAKADELAEAAA